MSATTVAPVHRCAFHDGPEQAGEIAAELTRRAMAAGSPVVAHVDDVVRQVLVERVPDAPVTFVPPRILVEVPLPVLAEDWARHLGPGHGGLVTVLCQRPVGLDPDVERWRCAEQDTTDAVAARPLTVTCLVDTTYGPPDGVAMARGTHPVLWFDGLDLPNPDLRPPTVLPARSGPVTEAVLDPRAAAANRRWWHGRLAAAGMPEGRREELVLVLHEAVTLAAALNGDPAAIRVRLTVAGDAASGTTVTGEVVTRTRCEVLRPSTVPSDRRLLMLWLAEKVSPAVTLAVLPEADGARFLVSAQPPDRA
ncbi:hypothetical protein [Geodermatophilus sp. URMC 63]